LKAKQKTLVVVGGGAAGFFCAVNAARLSPKLKVIILEKSNKLLSKVKVSGGGRCNVTHNKTDVPAMAAAYPRGQHFLKKTLHQFSQLDTQQWFADRGVRLKAEADGRMFPTTDNSQTIIDCLLQEATKYGVVIQLQTSIVQMESKAEGFALIDQRQQVHSADYLCIATGGYPKAEQYHWLTSIGMKVQNPVPSLFTFNMPKEKIVQLMGVSVSDVRVKVLGSKLEQEGPLLITHWGMSGPAILRLSAWGALELATNNYQFSIQVNWLPMHNQQSIRDYLLQLKQEQAKQKLSNHKWPTIPQRLWLFLLEEAGAKEDLRWVDCPNTMLNKLAVFLCNHQFEVSGKTTFKEEFVTAGGIDLSTIDVATCASKTNSHLFFAGEVMNADGITGGFNFQHAWSSGFVVANAIAQQMQEP
jgi:predicted Rossmann fold flavoprotein